MSYNPRFDEGVEARMKNSEGQPEKSSDLSVPDQIKIMEAELLGLSDALDQLDVRLSFVIKEKRDPISGGNRIGISNPSQLANVVQDWSARVNHARAHVEDLMDSLDI